MKERDAALDCKSRHEAMKQIKRGEALGGQNATGAQEEEVADPVSHGRQPWSLGRKKVLAGIGRAGWISKKAASLKTLSLSLGP